MKGRRNTSDPLLRKPVSVVRRWRALTGVRIPTQMRQTFLHSALCLLHLTNTANLAPPQGSLTSLNFLWALLVLHLVQRKAARIRNLIRMSPQTDLISLFHISIEFQTGEKQVLCAIPMSSPESSHKSLYQLWNNQSKGLLVKTSLHTSEYSSFHFFLVFFTFSTSANCITAKRICMFP